MTDPYWPWWIAPLWMASGWFAGWVLTVVQRPGTVECPNCQLHVRLKTFKLHWKVCND